MRGEGEGEGETRRRGDGEKNGHQFAVGMGVESFELNKKLLS